MGKTWEKMLTPSKTGIYWEIPRKSWRLLANTTNYIENAESTLYTTGHAP